MIFAAMTEAADRGELILKQDGLLRYHRRRDGVFVIHEIIVLPFRRRTGVGRNMVRDVLIRSNGSPVLANCPDGYAEANAFWPAVGFNLAGQRTTKKGTLVNIWQRCGNDMVQPEEKR